MNDPVYISSSSILARDVAEAARLLSERVKNIELSGGGRHDAGLLEKLALLRRAKGINFMVHSYFPPPAAPFILNFADTGEKTRAFVNESMRFVEGLGCPYYSIHAGFRKEFTLFGELLYENGGKKRYDVKGIGDNVRWFEANYPGKKLAVENLYPNNNNPESCFLMHIEEISRFMEEHGGVHLLLDLGHLQISARMFGFNFIDALSFLFGRYGDRIPEMHLSENNLMKDGHLLVNEDSLQYALVKEYSGIIREGGINLTIEARNAGVEELVKCKDLINEAIG